MFHSFGGSHLVGRFRLSVTTDDRSTFANIAQSGGDVYATWTVLTNPVASGPAGMTFTTLGDNSVLTGGTIPNTGTYEVQYTGNFVGITGVRLEAIPDGSIVGGQSGWGGGNFVLTEMIVTPAGSPLNQPPVANAGSDQGGVVNETVQLDGSGSSDPDNDTLTYDWQLTSSPSGSVTSLLGASLENPTFVPDVAGDYVVQLIVNDGTVNSNPDQVTITATAGALVNVSAGEFADFVLVYDLDIPNNMMTGPSGSPPYTADNSSSITAGSFDRIAYYLELNNGSGSQFVWVSMDPFTTDPSKIGVPTLASGAVFQTTIDNMNVESNVGSIVAGTGITTGNIEFWPYNYGTQAGLAGIPTGNNSLYDFNDLSANAADYGSMQIHNYGAGQTLMSYNRWGSAADTSPDDLGIGNNGGGQPDWTFQLNAATYTTKVLQVYVHPTTQPVADGASVNVSAGEFADFIPVYKLDIPDNMTTGPSGVPPYTTNNASSITDPFDRIAYYLELHNSSGSQFVWVSMDAFTTDPTKIGVPTLASGAVFQTTVDNMNAESNVSGIVTGSGIATGNIEFWPYNYNYPTGLGGIPSGNNLLLDFNDTNVNAHDYGSMQIHNYGAGQTLLAYSRWGIAADPNPDDLGIGNNTVANSLDGRTHPDWTFRLNAATYTTKVLEIYVHPITNQPPVANDGVDQTVECVAQTGTPVTLDGNGSSDPDGDVVTYAWSAQDITFDDPASATPEGTFPLGTTTVTLTVTDPSGESHADEVDVIVEDTTPPVAIAQDLTVVLEAASGTATITPQEVDDGSSDACGIASLSLDVTSFTLDDLGENTVTLTVTDNGGNASTATATIIVRVGPEIILGLDRFPADGGLVEIQENGDTGYDHQDWKRVLWSNYNNANGETHVAVGDIDGDGLDEFVVGLGYGGGGRLRIYDDADHGCAPLGWIVIPWGWYNNYNGKTWPGVGDVDGDGKAEVVVGLGYGGSGYVAIFDDLTDDGVVNFTLRRWLRVGGYYGDNRPALGDVDGDGRDEIVVGMGYRGQGRVIVFDDASQGYRYLRWLQVPWYDYNYVSQYRARVSYHRHYYSYWSRRWYRWYSGSYYYSYNNPYFNGETRPAVGDVDGDGREEIVVGLGRGGQGRMIVFDDAGANYAPRSWLTVPRNSYRFVRSWSYGSYAYYYRYYYTHGYGPVVDYGPDFNGETRPAIGDVDDDGKAEILAGLGSRGDGLTAIFDDAGESYIFKQWLQVHNSAYVATRGGTWPAVGNVVP